MNFKIFNQKKLETAGISLCILQLTQTEHLYSSSRSGQKCLKFVGEKADNNLGFIQQSPFNQVQTFA